MGRSHGGNGFGTRSGVPLQRPEMVVPALGHQERQVDARLGQMGQGGVAELVQGPALPGDRKRVVLEQVFGPLVRQPSPPGDRAEVDRRWRAGGSGAPCSEKDRSGPAIADQSWQETGRAGLEVEPVDVAPFAPYPQPLILQVKISHVARQDLVGPGRGLVEQSPQTLLADGDLGLSEESLER